MLFVANGRTVSFSSLECSDFSVKNHKSRSSKFTLAAFRRLTSNNARLPTAGADFLREQIAQQCHRWIQRLKRLKFSILICQFFLWILNLLDVEIRIPRLNSNFKTQLFSAEAALLSAWTSSAVSPIAPDEIFQSSFDNETVGLPLCRLSARNFLAYYLRGNFTVVLSKNFLLSQRAPPHSWATNYDRSSLFYCQTNFVCPCNRLETLQWRD